MEKKKKFKIMEALIQNKAKKQLLWLAMISMVMIFGSLSSGYIVQKGDSSDWLSLQELDPNWFLYSTITIVISSFFLLIASVRVRKDLQISKLIFFVFLLGLLFTYFQVSGWQELINQGVYFTGKESNVAGSWVYVMTLVHLGHLLGGLIALLVTSKNASKGMYNAKNFLGYDLTATYWHFLGFLWIYLYFFLMYV